MISEDTYDFALAVQSWHASKKKHLEDLMETLEGREEINVKVGDAEVVLTKREILGFKLGLVAATNEFDLPFRLQTENIDDDDIEFDD